MSSMIETGAASGAEQADRAKARGSWHEDHGEAGGDYLKAAA